MLADIKAGKIKRVVVKDMSRYKMEVFFLPPYAPEYNPDEYLNHALKISVPYASLICPINDGILCFCTSCNSWIFFAGGNEAAAGQYDLCGQQSGQGPVYDLSRHHEPAAADPVYGAPDSFLQTEGVSDGFVELHLNVLPRPP